MSARKRWLRRANAWVVREAGSEQEGEEAVLQGPEAPPPPPAGHVVGWSARLGRKGFGFTATPSVEDTGIARSPLTGAAKAESGEVDVARESSNSVEQPSAKAGRAAEAPGVVETAERETELPDEPEREEHRPELALPEESPTTKAPNDERSVHETARLEVRVARLERGLGHARERLALRRGRVVRVLRRFREATDLAEASKGELETLREGYSRLERDWMEVSGEGGEMHRLREGNQRLEARLEALQGELRSAKERASGREALEHNLQKCQDEIVFFGEQLEERESRCAEKEAEVGALSGRLEEMTAELDVLQRASEEQRTVIDDLRDALADARRERLEAVKGENEKAQTLVSREQVIESLNRELEELRSRVSGPEAIEAEDAREAAMAALQTGRDEWKSWLSRQDEALKERDRQIDTLQNELAGFASLLKERETRLSELESHRERDREETSERESSLERALAEAEKTERQLRARLEDVEETLREVSGDLETRKQRLSTVEERLKVVQGDEGSRRRKEQEKDEEIAAKNRQIEGLQTECRALEDRLDARPRLDFAKLENENERLRKGIEERNLEFRRLEETFNQARRDLRGMKRDFDEQSRELAIVQQAQQEMKKAESQATSEVRRLE